MPRSGRWTVRFLRLRTSIYIALLGFLVGLMVHEPARTVVWIVAGLLVAVFYVANVVSVRRYQQLLNRTRSGDGSSHSGGPNERQELQLWLLRRGARAFASYAVVGAGIAAAGIAVSFSYSTRARPEIIGVSVFAGAWLAWFGLGINKRLRAGPIARLAARNQSDNAVSVSGSDTDGT
jgi:uncharacterized membrane protein (Fun14 family)